MTKNGAIGKMKTPQEYNKYLQNKFNDSLTKLKSELLKYNPILIVTSLFFTKYCVCCRHAKEYSAEENPTEAPLELVIALILKHQYIEFEYVQPTQQDICNIYDLAFACCADFGWFDFSDEKQDPLFIHSIRNHTAFVRGESYAFQRRKYLQDILSKMDTKLHFGVDLRDVFNVFYNKLPMYLLEKDAKVLKNIKNGKQITLNEDIDNILVTAEELKPLFRENVTGEQIDKVLNLLSIGFGDLREIEDTRLFLDNPVQSKPIIKVQNGKYLMIHMLRMLTNSKKIIETLLASNKILDSVYRTKIRPKYLEDSLSNILTKAFPNAVHLKNTKYIYNGKEYENDHTLLIGDKVIIFEAKAAKPKDSVYRGSDLAFKENYKANIIYASEQANNFENFLRDKTEVFELPSMDGPVLIKPDMIGDVIKYNVILDSLPGNSILDKNNMEEYSISHNIEANVNPTFLLSDLEIVCDILDDEFLLIDFLIKKYQLSSKTNSPLSMGDDIDLLALYLDTGLNVDFGENIDAFMFSGYSSDMKIDEYYDLIDQPTKPKKPTIKADYKFMCIVNKIYSPSYRNITFCLNLLKMPYPDRNYRTGIITQAQFMECVERGISMTKKDKKFRAAVLSDIDTVLVFCYNETAQTINKFVKEKNLKKQVKFMILFDVKRIHRPFTEIIFFDEC